MMQGLITLMLLIAFVAVVVWAYSGKRRQDFEAAARLPFADEEPEQQRNRENDS